MSEAQAKAAAVAEREALRQVGRGTGKAKAQRRRDNGGSGVRKIPTVFRRDPDNMARVLNEVNPGCEWVLAGEGVATRKYDGTCVRISHGWYDGPQVGAETRREVKAGKEPPPHWIEVDRDEATGKRVGWEPYGQSSFAKFVEEALGRDPIVEDWPEGTYELCGPKINGNPEGFACHTLVRHVRAGPISLPLRLDFETLRLVLTDLAEDGIEGLVWHHIDGRMAKLKGRDFR